MTTGVRAAEHDLPPVPATLLEEVGEARRELTAAASGRVFVVPEAGAEPALESERASGARYDTILSFMCTPGVADIEGFVAAVEGILAEEGWIFMVEPVPARPAGAMGARLGGGLVAARRTLLSGFKRLGSRLMAGPRRGSAPRSTGIDVVAALRSGGLVVTDLHRREALSAPAAWRHYVVLKARRESPRTADL